MDAGVGDRELWCRFEAGRTQPKTSDLFELH